MGDRVGQTVGVTTTYFALDGQGLPEVIYTSQGETFLHLPGVIMTESPEGDVRYLLSDGLGSVRQAVDETGAVVAYQAFDPYGNPADNNGGEPYGFTGEWWESYSELLYLRARWLMPETGTFLSRDSVEGEPPYAYVRGRVANLTDPSGYFPTKDDVENEDAQFTCNCGWIDWNHVRNSDRLGFELMDDLTYANSIFSSDSWRSDNWAIDVYVQVGFAGLEMKLFDATAVVPNPSIRTNGAAKLAVSIFMDANETFEETQGALGTLPIPIIGGKFNSSYYSEEDLSSDIIGFYIGMQRFNLGQDYEILKNQVQSICRAVDREESLRVFREVYDNGTSAVTGWKKWYPRLTSENNGGCETCDEPRQWPSTFSRLTSQRVYPQLDGDWWWGYRPYLRHYLMATEHPRVNRLSLLKIR